MRIAPMRKWSRDHPIVAIFCLYVCVLILGALVLLTRPAHAATITNTVRWVAPTQYTDGTALPATALVGFNVYCGTAPNTYTAVTSAAATATSITVPA